MLTLDLKGFSEIMSNLDRMSNDIKTEVSATLERGAQTYVRNAKRDAPVDHGRLKNSITYFQNAPLSFEVVCSVDYAAYVEFGTIKYVFYGEPWINEEIETVASNYRGRGLRKNGGIYPRPFFYKPQPQTKAQIEDGIDAILKDLKL